MELLPILLLFNAPWIDNVVLSDEEKGMYVPGEGYCEGGECEEG